MELERKGTHHLRNIQYNNFVVGCDSIEKVQEFLKNYRLQSGKVREYDLEGYLNHASKDT